MLEKAILTAMGCLALAGAATEVRESIEANFAKAEQALGGSECRTLMEKGC